MNSQSNLFDVLLCVRLLPLSAIRFFDEFKISVSIETDTSES